jgi:hypothetical protein
MANTFNDKVWNVTEAGVLHTERVKLKNIRWTGADVDDVCILKDATGQIFFKSTSEDNNWNDEQLYENWVNGITVDTIESGLLILVLW